MSHAQDVFLSKRFGVFNHYLYGNPSDGAKELSARRPLDWNTCVDSVDVRDLARRVHETGAGYYFLTLMQGSRYLLGPNAAYDSIAGTRPGEACSRRDLVGELIDELAVYGIDLYLYYTGDGPHVDQEIGGRFGYVDPRGQVPGEFVERWAAVLREYAVRYGGAVKGWWIDGCYAEGFGYTPELLTPYYEACKAGNPDCLVAMNDGIKPRLKKYYPREEFVCGEENDFELIPPSRFIDGAQAHLLAPLGISENEYTRWRKPGSRRTKEYMLDYVRRANQAGMPVSIDVFVGHDGSWDAEQFETLRYIGENL